MNEFQENAEASAFYMGGNDMDRTVYCALGLAEEAGEVVGKVKKLYRDRGGVIDDEWRVAIGNELGDALWYLSTLASGVGLTLEDVARMNMEKRSRRREAGTTRGDGDER
jgi:NTP pyrophosphatase (non-canonical NTP hydrolase)